MKSLYARLAVQNMRASARLYVPYVLSSAVMVTVLYLLLALSQDPAMLALPDSPVVSMMLTMGVAVMVLFSLLFLQYTSSFLMKRRSRELGLYSVLGMSRGHILRVVLWETALCAAAAILLGIALGLLLFKLVQLTLVRLMGGAPPEGFAASPYALAGTPPIVLALYVPVFLRQSVFVLRANPLEILRQAQAGEKPPRANVLLAAAGAALLLTGYAMALRVRAASDALSVFFVAVLLVVVGTFAVFRSASVFVLTALKKNKRFYYRPGPFVSVSGMLYRMRRNGDSLAAICILLTMVLVMMCSSSCLYVGIEDILRTRYPFEIAVTQQTRELPPAGELSARCEEALDALGVSPERSLGYRELSLIGRIEEGRQVVTAQDEFSGVSGFTFIPLADYNAAMGTDYALAPGEALLDMVNGKMTYDALSLFGVRSYRIVESGVTVPEDAASDGYGILSESALLVVPDEEDLTAIAEAWRAAYPDTRVTEYVARYGFDVALAPQEHDALAASLKDALGEVGLSGLRVRTREDGRVSMLAMAVGLLFLGVMLSVAFLGATALSVYYKQVTEGYEDAGRYEVMRRVGLSRAMIHRSVRGQLLAVFFSPPLLALLHLCCAFPMLTKLLMVFGLVNTRLMALSTLVTYAVTCAVYAGMYGVTSRVYERIVQGGERAR